MLDLNSYFFENVMREGAVSLGKVFCNLLAILLRPKLCQKPPIVTYLKWTCLVRISLQQALNEVDSNFTFRNDCYNAASKLLCVALSYLFVKAPSNVFSFYLQPNSTGLNVSIVRLIHVFCHFPCSIIDKQT